MGDRKQELIDKILDCTPYTKQAGRRERLEKKLNRVLTEDDLYILATATTISISTITNRLNNQTSS